MDTAYINVTPIDLLTSQWIYTRLCRDCCSITHNIRNSTLKDSMCVFYILYHSDLRLTTTFPCQFRDITDTSHKDLIRCSGWLRVVTSLVICGFLISSPIDLLLYIDTYRKLFKYLPVAWNMVVMRLIWYIVAGSITRLLRVGYLSHMYWRIVTVRDFAVWVILFTL